MVKEKGITLIALVITIVILLIISAITITSAIRGVDESQENKVKSELGMIQHAIVERYTKYKLTKDSTLLVGTIVLDADLENPGDGNSWQITNSDSKSNDQKYYELNAANAGLSKLGLDPGVEGRKNTYIVNYYTGEVYDKTNKIYFSPDQALVKSSIYTSSQENQNHDVNTSPSVLESDLVVYYDAKNNTGNGTYDKTATQWKNLTGDSYNGMLNNFDNTTNSGWQDGEYLKFDGSNDWVKIGKINNPNFTVEVVVEYDDPSKDSIAISNAQTGGIEISSYDNINTCEAYIGESYRKVNRYIYRKQSKILSFMYI